MKRKLIVLSLMLSFLPFISNEILAQDVGYDAYFRYESNPEQRVPYYLEGFGFDGMSPTAGYGFTFDLFDEIFGNGFGFDNFGNGTNNNSLEFGNFEMAADDVPLSGGMLLLLGFVLIWRRRQILEADFGRGNGFWGRKIRN